MLKEETIKMLRSAHCVFECKDLVIISDIFEVIDSHIVWALCQLIDETLSENHPIDSYYLPRYPVNIGRIYDIVEQLTLKLKGHGRYFNPIIVGIDHLFNMDPIPSSLMEFKVSPFQRKTISFKIIFLKENAYHSLNLSLARPPRSD